jgi:hypothetical protein
MPVLFSGTSLVAAFELCGKQKVSIIPLIKTSRAMVGVVSR